jgi:hypothetical protein
MSTDWIEVMGWMRVEVLPLASHKLLFGTLQTYHGAAEAFFSSKKYDGAAFRTFL